MRMGLGSWELLRSEFKIIIKFKLSFVLKMGKINIKIMIGKHMHYVNIDAVLAISRLFGNTVYTIFLIH